MEEWEDAYERAMWAWYERLFVACVVIAMRVNKRREAEERAASSTDAS